LLLLLLLLLPQSQVMTWHFAIVELMKFNT
jgi:hypothetical protein